MRRIPRLLIAVCLVALVAAPAAFASERMWVGFHDDPSFRWAADREAKIARSADTQATIIRLLVQWNLVAKTKPANASNPFDPAYTFDDVDEAVRTAQDNDQEVILTISGTPSWANGGKTPNFMPTRVSDFTAFAKAIASRYSGRYQGYPFVRFWAIWNEPNLQLFLTPQFNAAGKSVAPANYAKLAAAGYAGIKAGDPQAKVAIGETSARGSDNATGIRPTHSPGKFAQLVAKANPRLKFDAWGQHPYPFVPSSPPSAKVRWPNVSLGTMQRLEDNLKVWFKRKSVPIWITEYGHQTKPPDPLGVSYATQAAFIQQAISIARSYSFVDMFIWFVFQDDPGQPWQSGIYAQNGAAKGTSPARFAASARPLDARNAVVSFRGGTVTPLVNVYTRRYCATDTTGTPIGMTWRVYEGAKLIKVGQQSAPLRADCTINARLQFTVAKGKAYTATFALNDASGVLLNRRLTIRGT